MTHRYLDCMFIYKAFFLGLDVVGKIFDYLNESNLLFETFSLSITF